MQGFRVFHARNSEEALALLRSESAISLVILNLTMPVMTGERAIRLNQSIRPGVPIILSSGFGENRDLAPLRRFWYRECFRKTL